MKKANKTEQLVTLGLQISGVKNSIYEQQRHLRRLEDERDALLQEISPAIWTLKGTPDPGDRFSI